jgi:Zn-dependent protease
MGEIDIATLVSHLIIYMVVLLLAISAHEAGHAWMSHKFGDDTAYMLGRVTLNPVSHTDPIGTLFIPIVAFVLGTMGGALGSIPLIGWGKPTPVNPSNWTNYRLANVMVSIAGVLANLILLLMGLALAKILYVFAGFDPASILGRDANPLGIFVKNLMFLNLSLFIFNLLPFPPLDGSKILSTFLPESAQPIFEMLETYGFLILMFLIYIGVFSLVIYPFWIGLRYIVIAMY